MSGYLSGIVAILCINLIFAYGLFVPAAAGQINLGGAGFQAIGAYSAAWLSSVALLPMWLTIPAAMLVAGLIGFLISFPVLRTRGVYMVLATFAFGEVVAGFLLRTQFFGGAIGMVVPAHVELPVLVACAVAVTLLAFYLMATRFGLAMRSINDDEAAAVLMGVNVRAVQVGAFAIGGALAGLSGALYAHNFSFVEAQYFNSFLSISVAVRPHRRRADRVGTVSRHAVFYRVARAHAGWRLLALCGLWRSHCDHDDNSPAGDGDPHDRRSVITTPVDIEKIGRRGRSWRITPPFPSTALPSASVV